MIPKESEGNHSILDELGLQMEKTNCNKYGHGGGAARYNRATTAQELIKG